MPSLLLSNNAVSLERNNEKSPVITRDRSNLERQLELGSIEAACQLASLTEYKHDEIHGCYNCDLIAKYYILGFQSVKNSKQLECDSILLGLVQQVIQFIQCHLDISRIEHVSWLPVLMNNLRELGKQIKDESNEADRYVPLPPTSSQMETVGTDISMDNSVSGEYGRAIRISIYYCRAALCEEVDTAKSVSYYRKCVSVRPSPVESQNFQQSAKLALLHLIADHATNRPRLPSRTSSVSSGASSSCSMSCSNCGVEKRGIPVCSKCKSRYYCGVRCLKAHKPIHDAECGNNL
ncbi:uncharacterized protein EV154DRAFT_525584 [Mucor mucedo]|uniref:uncharacterized protein n=1 Tax=Mucor mucedo TaxID=29922 RepID=UPI00221EB711|nr:uncharacterized protein EV154DRAFT_525584 [Mucor mucedo]KAI7877080.1 hypothetical protein EV154DRAFT_525584 [Mucor mucedo]